MAKIRFYEDPEFLRKQTLFILISVACLILTAITPLFNFQSNAQALNLELTGAAVIDAGIKPLETATQAVQNRQYLDWLQAALIAGSVFGLTIILFFYRQRAQQLKWLRIMVGLLFLLAAVVAANVFSLQNGLKTTIEKLELTPDFGLVFFAAPLFLLIFANRAIRADIAKLRKMDRFW